MCSLFARTTKYGFTKRIGARYRAIVFLICVWDNSCISLLETVAVVCLSCPSSMGCGDISERKVKVFG